MDPYAALIVALVILLFGIVQWAILAIYDRPRPEKTDDDATIGIPKKDRKPW